MRKILGIAFVGMVASCGGSSADNAGGGGGGGGGGADGGATRDAEPAGPAPLATGLTVTDIAVFQASKAFLVQKGAALTPVNAPVIGSRPGVMRVYVKPSDSWQPHRTIAELHMSSGGQDLPVLTDPKTITTTSDDADNTTLFEFTLDPATLVAGTTFSIAIREESGKPRAQDPSDPIYPADGTLADLGVIDNTEVKIKFVPVKYNADNSGRLPDISAAQIERYRSTLYKMYPTSKITLTVREPLPWSTPIDPGGTGWDEMIQGIADLRSTDNAPADVYYVGAFEPAATINQYCAQGCILGVAPLASAVDVSARLALVVGYSGQEAPDTLNQELAHAMGRSHAPCGGAAGPDPRYPYPGAKIGQWGFDVMKSTFINPTSVYRDFMSYCTPIWISDYTFNALSKRIAFVNKPHSERGAVGSAVATAPTRFSWIHVGANGALKWGRTVTLDHAPEGEAIDVALHASNGAKLASVPGAFFAYDNLPGGYVLVPESATATSRFSSVRINGVALPVAQRLAQPLAH